MENKHEDECGRLEVVRQQQKYTTVDYRTNMPVVEKSRYERVTLEIGKMVIDLLIYRIKETCLL